MLDDGISLLRPPLPNNDAIKNPCHKLIEALKARKEPPSLSQVKKGKVSQVFWETPLIILAFDEAHTMTNREQEKEELVKSR